MVEGSPKICVVGPSKRFLSGITYYTYSLCRALSARREVSAILMRQLLPTSLYPGRERVGASISHLELPATVQRFNGVDWFWLPTLFQALWFLVRRRPAVLILQWWTGTVLHSYLALAALARALGIKIVIEFHEVLDPGEDGMAWVSRYVNLGAPWLFRLASGYVVHSEYDRGLVAQRYGATAKPMATIPHATYDHYRKGGRWRKAPEDCCNLLFFGLIRPYKGLEDLVRAFDAIPPDQIERYWLTIVGETWEGWTLPGDLIEQSRYRDRITFVNRYVADEEVDGVFGGADLVVLPYHRSSQSGALHIALHYGLPVVVTAVGGLVEAVEGYGGAILTEPGDPDALLRAIQQAAKLRGQRFADPRGWENTVALYQSFLSEVCSDPRAHTGAEPECETLAPTY
jgi:glycosyltransferase involved in cell wall biosynthesis